MKKWILLLVSSLFLLSCSKGTAKLPDDLGEFKLGMSMHSVVTMLNSKGLSELKIDGPIGMFDEEFPKCSYGVMYFNDYGRADMVIRFSTSSPYFYDEKKWERVFLEFYQGELYSIILATYYEGRSGIEECFKTYKDEEQKLHSRYKKYEKGTNSEGDYSRVSYENDNKYLYVTFAEEGNSSYVALALVDFEMQHKCYERMSSGTTDSAVEVVESVEVVED